ncbi:MAG: polyprenyl synthetase family protein [Nitriliruptorales bacterium]
MATAPPELARFRETVDEALTGAVAVAVERLTATHARLAPLADELAAFVLAAGKRLRPALVLIGWEAAGHEELRPAVGPALAVELVHTCALVHDDLIDDADVRRGRPAAHHAFADRHARAGWAGTADTFGRAAALLLGDLAFVAADELFLRAADDGVPADRVLAALRVFTTLREEVTAGQFLDVVAQSSGVNDPDLALTIATYKSGRYSVARPLELGALLGGAPELAAGLARAGLPLGTAFQLRDDVLGVFGREEETGKSTLSDLAEGKRTLLVALTAGRLEDAERRRFEALLGDPRLDESGAKELRRLMRASGALAETERRAAALVDEALHELASLAVPSATRSALEGLARFLVARRG